MIQAARALRIALVRHRTWLIPALVSVATCVAMSYTTASQMQPRFFYTADLEYMEPWRARVFTNFLSGHVLAHGPWGGAFFGLICLAYLLLDRRAATFLILGTFGAIHATYALPDGMGMKAWDLPAMWVYAVLVAAVARRRVLLIAFVSVLGIGFKETALLGAAAIPFASGWPLRRRLLLCAATLFCGVVFRTLIDAAVGNPLLGSLDLMERNATGGFFDEPTKSHFGWNVGWLLLKVPWTPILLNGGTLVALFLLPSSLPHIAAWRTIAALLIGGNMVAGRISEWRIFLELVPPAIWLIYEWTARAPAEGLAAGAPAERLE